MKKLKLGKSELEVGEISLGCMRINKLEKKDARYVIENAMDTGVDLFDHADIYGAGESESVFAEAIDMNDDVREKMKLQTKCGIRDGYFDFSKDHILESVEGSLKRLKTDYVDSLLLHRPDALFEPEEVAEAFAVLKESGKVRYFGVSNQNPMQIELLKKYLKEDLIVNQMQLSVVHTPMIDAGFNVNMQNDPAIMRDGSIIEYCRLHDISIQAWSPFQHGMIEGPFVGNKEFPQVNAKLKELAEKYGVTDSAIAIAWILRHPANIQPVVGTMNTERMRNIAKASDIELTRQEWYELYTATGNELP
ncbi:aldo/keto reductase [Halobacillus halophilus]|uniref:Aldo/keto reductase family protein n=1 Tax=Halobacillus halophilus (strain ATCC 35676 / DSM 2266 / JCM 20832 / KCTC 3685 / LMG 17431 / NBRC 102448 / NCIMB 2269) TaxID=866895 RepID=I0JSL2_HALH3|nr:aldo/keto reductase [Halobacillus halophilus]ASF41068.1 aldo/keto reductase [Halobacillus halophilus]CCG47134.1 aldo/keto reductase family protein [Halobacillus halophilus DSM 2266]